MSRPRLLFAWCILLTLSSSALLKADDDTPSTTTTGSSSSKNVLMDALKKLQETFGNTAASAQQARQQRHIPELLQHHGHYQPPKKTAPTRRKALMEYTLVSHYHHHDHESSSYTSHHLQHAQLPEDSSWGHGPCIFYNERKSNYWTYQWCFHSKVQQSHYIPNKKGQFHAEVTHSLGHYTESPPKEHDDFDTSSAQSVEYYQGGDECVVQQQHVKGSRTMDVIHRQTLILKNPSPQCDASHREWRIVAVTEPSPCFYVLYVCGPREQQDNGEERTSRTDAQQQQDKSQHHHASTTTPDSPLPILQAYLQDALPHYNDATMDRTTSWHAALPPLPKSRIQSNLHLIKDMFQHAYDSYMEHAFPSSEIQPLTCTPTEFNLVKLPALTLIDALDTLLILNNTTEFARSVERLRPMAPDIFSVNQNVSVFETNIRVLGGLLSAHQLAEAIFGEMDVLASHVWDADGNVRYGVVVEEETTTDKPTAAPTSKDTCVVDNAERTTPETKSSDDTTAASQQVCDVKKKKQNTTKTCGSQQYWAYDGLLLRMAHDLGKRLLRAFDTKTGIPYGTVNLLHGIPEGETTVASLAGGGTLTLEMELLSRLTGDDVFGKAAKLASRALWMRKSPRADLLGKHIEITRGEWTESLSGIGSNSDSFYEYLIKHYVLFPEDADFWTMFVSTYNGVYNGTRLGEWYADVDMSLGTRNGASRRVFESLQAFYPGMQTLVGELGPAARTLNSFFLVREFLGFLPERFNYAHWKVDGGPHGAGFHPLRPELLESCYFLHQSTKLEDSSGWQWAADFALHTLNEITDTTCGFASVKDLSPTTTGTIPPETAEGVKLANEMPSFFLSETLKYLYLTFDKDNILHQDDEREWIFTTEAHPIHHVPKGGAAAAVKSKESSKPVDGTRKSESKSTVKSPEEKELDRMKQEVRDLLERRLAQHHVPNPTRSVASPSKPAGLMFEKWADNTHMSGYVNTLRASNHATLTRKRTRGPWRLFRQYLVPEDSNERNFAYLSFGDMGLGDGSSLSKWCPNFYRSSLLWIRALNGGVLDYTDDYLSSLSDDLFVDTIQPEALTAVEALAYHGSGLYLGEFPKQPSCRASREAEKAVSPETTPQADSESNVQRFNMGDGLGEFDISAFDEGFMIKRLETSETLITTVLADEKAKMENTNEADSALRNLFVMVYSIRPVENESSDTEEPRPKNRWGGKWRSMFGEHKEQESLPEEFERKVVYTNGENQAFRCEIHLFATPEKDTEEEELLTVYPCAPALFGPTNLPRLVQIGELEVGGEVRLPDPDDEMGCSEGDSYAPTTIQMVRRGTCTFQFKANNQFMRSGAEAVIVINNQADELFVMADGSVVDEEQQQQDGDTPLTVLMSKNDGDEMVAAIEEGVASTARVSVVPQKSHVDATGQLTGPIDWPVVKASSNLVLQIFSENGWGVHAVNRMTNNQQQVGGREWQLFLTKHTLKP